MTTDTTFKLPYASHWLCSKDRAL